MTNEEAKHRLLNIERSLPNTFHTKEDVRNFEALEMAIKALEQELCEDAISRQAVLKEFEDDQYSLDYCMDAAINEWRGELNQAIEKALEKQTRWIPVSERLPEDGQYVMVTFGGKIAVCLAQDNNGTLQEVTSLISENATEIWLYPEPKWGDGYAAWMPLPEPYTEESEES